jgi:phosphoribosylglycinamide formyltransferase-1
MASRCKTAILISGSGTNLQAFIDAVEDGSLDLELAVVFSNNPDAYGLERAEQAGIPTACIQHADFLNRESFDHAVIAELDRFKPELLILAGFMRILSPSFVAHYSGKILNIHPALLPLYPGLNTHQRVLDAGDTWHGSTVHFVTEELDGGPRILQGRLAVVAGETADELATRVQAIEHRIYPEAAGWVGSGKVMFRDGECWVDDRLAEEPPIQTFSKISGLG